LFFFPHIFFSAKPNEIGNVGPKGTEPIMFIHKTKKNAGVQTGISQGKTVWLLC